MSEFVTTLSERYDSGTVTSSASNLLSSSVYTSTVSTTPVVYIAFKVPLLFATTSKSAVADISVSAIVACTLYFPPITPFVTDTTPFSTAILAGVSTTVQFTVLPVITRPSWSLTVAVNVIGLPTTTMLFSGDVISTFFASFATTATFSATAESATFIEPVLIA